MATLFVAAGGSNTAPYASWATAATSLATALAAAVAGDIVVIQRDGVPAADKELAADTNYAVPGGVLVMSGTNLGGSSYAYSPMGESVDWIGNSTLNRSVTFYPTVSGQSIRLAGLTLRLGGSTTDSINLLAASQLGLVVGDDVTFWCGNTSASSRVNLGSVTSGQQAVVVLNRPVFRFSAAGHGIVLRSSTHVTIVGGRLSGSSVAPTELFQWATPGPNKLDVTGFDASLMGSGCTLVGDAGSGLPQVFLRQVRRGAGCAVLATQTTTTRLGIEVWEYECQVGSTLNVSGYHTAFGSVTNDASVYLTAGPTSQSWRIVTTAACSAATPFATPWTDWYQPGTTSITPRIEVLRTDSTTPLTDAQLAGEFTARVTAGSVVPTLYSDAAPPGAAGADQAAGAGTGSWTGAGGTAWSGKCEVPALTPAAAGRLRGRIVVSAPSLTVYADQLIRA